MGLDGNKKGEGLQHLTRSFANKNDRGGVCKASQDLVMLKLHRVEKILLQLEICFCSREVILFEGEVMEILPQFFSELLQD